MGYHSKLAMRRTPVEIDRRKFILTSLVAGGGLMVGLTPVSEALAAVAEPEPWMTKPGTDFTAFITITPDNRVVIRGTSPDIGNGTFTATPMIVTEELRCDWDLVSSEFIPVNRDLADGGLYSSSGLLAYFSGRSTGDEVMKQLLQIGASTRERLRAAAAKRWGVDVAAVTAEKSILTNTTNNETLTFGQVCEDAATVELAAEPALKPRSEWTFLGKESPKKLQLPLILNGSAKYGIDVIVPNMLYAALRQVPAHGGRLKSYNADAVMGLPGVRAVVVVDPDEIRPGLPEGMRAPFGMSASTNGPQAAVAVIADHFWQAQTALDLLPVEWDAGAGAEWTNTQKFYDHLMDRVANPVEPNVIKDVGDVTAAMSGGADIEIDMMTPYMDHFNMEPLNGTALVTDTRVDVWFPSQHPQQGLYLVADETGVHPKDVHIHQTWVGTGLGRRVFGDDMRMVAAIANKMRGTPIKVIWSREESMRQGRYRQIMAGRLSGKLGPDGMPAAVSIALAGAGANGTGIAGSPYTLGVPNWRVSIQQVNSNLFTGPWRGPVYNSNTFMLETLINQMAEKAGIDAIEYRMRMLSAFEDKAWVKLLEVVRDKSGWGSDLGRGVAQGVAIGNWGMGGYGSTEAVPYSGTTAAAVVTAEVSRRGQIYIPRVDIAVDTGSVINQEAVRLMVEGAVVLSLGAALHEEINIANGAVVEGNLDTYRLMRQNDPSLPTEIHVHFEGLSGHERFAEIGEPPMGPPPPALAHAVAKLTGKWMLSHPFDKIDLT